VRPTAKWIEDGIGRGHKPGGRVRNWRIGPGPIGGNGGGSALL